MENFEIITPKFNTEAEFIWCPTKDLKLRVIPPHLRSDEYEDNSKLVLNAAFFDAEGQEPNKADTYEFEVLEYEKGYEKNWTMDLFFEAIEYYCKVRGLEKPVVGYGNDPRFYPFGGD